MVTRVLVIDDDEPIRVLFATALERRGYDVSTAPSGDGGVEAAMKISPDLILLDLETPGMDGWNTLSALRAQPLLAGIPVVLLTARGSIWTWSCERDSTITCESRSSSVGSRPR
jgi:DNA-binding response OmpR family regulator